MRQQRTLRAGDALTKAEAAKRANVTPRTIGRWLADETVPLTRYTNRVNRVVVSKRELDSFLAARIAS
jgi:DNA-binding XRE family transcriptional regulator